MRIAIKDLLQAMFAVAFLAACIFGQWRGDAAAPLRLAILLGALGIVVAGIRYFMEMSPRYLVAVGISGIVLLVSCVLLILD